MAQALFDKVFAIVVGIEGGFTDDPTDPGNWTGGRRFAGELHGTKFGISAAAYPHLDIKSLTRAHAEALYLSDYWQPLDLDGDFPPFAVMMFDAAVNCGVHRATVFLQAACKVDTDGVLGPVTRAARGKSLAINPIGLCEEILARRIDYTAKDADWLNRGLGWSRRFARLPFDAMRLAETLLPDKGPLQ